MVIRKGFYADGHFDSKVDGEYVKYEDYAALEQKLKEERARLNQWRVKYGFPEVEYLYD